MKHVADRRNSKVPDLVAELRGFGVNADVVDPHADAAVLAPAHAVVLASPHRAFLDDAVTQVFGALAEGPLDRHQGEAAAESAAVGA